MLMWRTKGDEKRKQKNPIIANTYDFAKSVEYVWKLKIEEKQCESEKKNNTE